MTPAANDRPAGDFDQVHRLHTKTVKVARELGLGVRGRHGTSWLFSKDDERRAREEIQRRHLGRKLQEKYVTTLPEYDRRRRDRGSRVLWKEDWRRLALMELKSVELALLDLSRKVHTVSALILADCAAPWNSRKRRAS